MKLIRIMIVLALVMSFMPLDAFCADHHEEEEHQEGMVLCHTSCCGAVLISAQSLDLPQEVASFDAAQDFSYDEPVLPAEVKPPISVS